MSETRTPSTSEVVVGRDPPRQGTRHFFGTYVGGEPGLTGHGAMLMDSEEDGYVVAQFNDHSTGKSYGWWKFPELDFQVDADA